MVTQGHEDSTDRPQLLSYTILFRSNGNLAYAIFSLVPTQVVSTWFSLTPDRTILVPASSWFQVSQACT